jgi:hypothetical protein
MRNLHQIQVILIHQLAPLIVKNMLKKSIKVVKVQNMIKSIKNGI